MGEPLTVSIIIPVYNGSHTLDRCIAAVLTSANAARECIVVDDRSTDDSAAIARRHAGGQAGAHSGNGTLVRVIDAEEHGGPARARNLGARAASGDILLFIDADVCVHADTIASVISAFTGGAQVDALIGSYDFEPAAPNFLSQYKNLFHSWVHHNGRRDAVTFWTGCGAVRRTLFAACGGFNEQWRRPSVEDIEFGGSIRRAGGHIVLDPAVQVQHLKHWSFTGLLRTDIFDRAIPWTMLVLGQGAMPNDLNLRMDQRICVALVWIALCAAPKAPAIAGAALLLAIAWNVPLYRFLAKRRGWIFALRAVPLHLLYFLYCGGALVVGMVLYALQSLRGGKRERVAIRDMKSTL